MQKVLEELKEESRLKISQENSKEVVVVASEVVKTKRQTDWKILKQNNVQQFNQLIKEA